MPPWQFHAPVTPLPLNVPFSAAVASKLAVTEVPPGTTFLAA